MQGRKPTVSNFLVKRTKEFGLPWLLRCVVESELSDAQRQDEKSAVAEKCFEVLPTLLKKAAADVKDNFAERMMSRFFCRYYAFAC